MKWTRLPEIDLPDSDLAPPEAALDAASAAVGEIAGLPDTALEEVPRSLAEQEQSALRRLAPRRNRWPELAEFDERVGELDKRRVEVEAELDRLRRDRNAAPERDTRRLAEWIAADEKGKKPEPTAPELDRQIEDAERERDALLRASDDVLLEKERYVEKNRKRLVRQADTHSAKLRERVEQLVGELESTRAELSETRSCAVWASLYPDRSASAAPPNMIAGGQRRLLEQAGISSQVNFEQLTELLRADANWLASALTQAQAEALGMKSEAGATWGGTPEAVEAERKEKARQREDFKRLWGREPDEFSMLTDPGGIR